jgi:predicted PurR-regulated permease PerM
VIHQPTDRATLWFFLILMGFFAVLVGKLVAPYAVSLLVGGTIAMLMAPMYQKILSKGLKPPVAAVAVTVFVILAILIPLLALSLIATKQAVGLAQSLSQGFGSPSSQGEFFESLRNLQDSPFFSTTGLANLIDVKDLHDGFKEAAAAALKSASNFIIETAKSLPDGILQIFLTILACFFFLMDGTKGAQWILIRLPLESDIRDKIKESFQSTTISVIWASMAAAGTQALLVLLSFAFLGIPSALLAAASTFVFAWIPLLGSTPVIIAGSIYLYSQGSLGKLLILLVMGLVTGIVDNFVRPLVLKGRGEMHPLTSMIAIFGGIQLMGIVGILLGPVIMSVAITLLKIWPMIGKKTGFFLGANPPD